MKQKIIIYGDEIFASTVKHNFDFDSNFEVSCFSVHHAFKTKDQFHGLPVIAFENLINLYPPERYKMFVAIGYKHMNQLRKDICEEAKKCGYQLVSYVSSKTNYWGNLAIGSNVFINDGTSIGPNTVIGDGVIILHNVAIPHNIEINEYVYISPGVVIGGFTKIECNSFIGLNVTIISDITIGRFSLIAAGSNVIKSTFPSMVYMGNPAKNSLKNSSDVKI